MRINYPRLLMMHKDIFRDLVLCKNQIKLETSLSFQATSNYPIEYRCGHINELSIMYSDLLKLCKLLYSAYKPLSEEYKRVLYLATFKEETVHSLQKILNLQSYAETLQLYRKAVRRFKKFLAPNLQEVADLLRRYYSEDRIVVETGRKQEFAKVQQPCLEK